VNVDCAAFERWLDEGRTVAGAADARAHAVGCGRCASLLELEEALVAPMRTSAPADFSEAVMRRVHAGPARRLVPSVFPMPMWLQALVDPVVALTLTAVVLTWFGRNSLVNLGGALASRWETARWPAFAWPTFAWPALNLPGAAALGSVSQAIASLSTDPALLTAVLMAIAPAVLLGSWQLFRWTDRWISGAAAPAALHHAGAHAVAR
jgi:hypothetical protein